VRGGGEKRTYGIQGSTLNYILFTNYILATLNNVLYKFTNPMQVMYIKDAVQSVCKQRLCLHFGIQNIEIYSTTIYIFMILEYNKLSRDNNQSLQEHKMK
jgi:hypothetical protein